MIRLNRSEQRDTPIQWAGHTVVTVAETWQLRIVIGPVRWQAVYHRPVRVEVDRSEPRLIRDHVMEMRMATALLMPLARLVGRAHR